MPTSTPHVREATHSHYEIAQSHTHKHTVRRPATHTHTHGQATSHTHTRVVGEHHAQGHTNHDLRRENTITHCSSQKNHKVAYTLMPKRNEIETQRAKSR